MLLQDNKSVRSNIWKLGNVRIKTAHAALISSPCTYEWNLFTFFKLDSHIPCFSVEMNKVDLFGCPSVLTGFITLKC